MRNLNKIILTLIFLIALFLRVYKLGQYPVGFLWDEAALGYNSFSILQTGRDEYNNFLPIIFKSFGDYKPGFYVYLTIPSILIFGLNEFAVRFPSALCGALTVLLVYFLVKEAIFPELTQIKSRINSNVVPTVAALLLAISPWHINFSRGAWELNVMLFEVILGLYLLIKAINLKEKKQLLFVILSAAVFVLSLFTYQAAKLLTPALIFGLYFCFRNEIKKISLKSKTVFLTITIAGFIGFNLITMLGGKSGRLKVMSIFSYPRSVQETQMLKTQDENNELDFKLFHSSPVFFVRSVLGRYFNYFSGKFLFISGDWSNIRNGTIYQGVLYYADMIFLLIGIEVLLGKKRSQFENFVLYWLLVAPVPAALTRDSISSVRSFTMVIPLVIIVSVGLYNAIYWFDQRLKSKMLAICLTVFLYAFFFGRFLDLYFVHDKFFTSEGRLFGYREMIDFIKPMVGGKNKVVITSKYGQPYIFYLFYTKYDPKKYQKQARLKENIYGDVGEVEKIDNIEFKKIYWPDERGFSNSLFVGDEFELPLKDTAGQKNITLLKQINFYNNKTAFRIVETN